VGCQELQKKKEMENITVGKIKDFKPRDLSHGHVGNNYAQTVVKPIIKPVKSKLAKLI
jgi:hypothetical protein